MNLETYRNKIALTFDDGPAEHTSTILDILKREKIKATFFVIGKNIVGNEIILQRIVDEGHIIGNHSYHHGFNFDWQSVDKMIREISMTNDAINSVTGIETKLFRPPYGVTNPNLAKAIRATNMKSTGWNLRSFDTTAKDERTLLHKILSKINGGDIVLLHDRCSITEKILPNLIQELKRRGFEFIAVE